MAWWRIVNCCGPGSDEVGFNGESPLVASIPCIAGCMRSVTGSCHTRGA